MADRQTAMPHGEIVVQIQQINSTRSHEACDARPIVRVTGSVKRPLALHRYVVWAFGVLLIAGGSGCGSNLQYLLIQSADAVGATYIDLWLTDFANQLADAQDAAANDPDGTGGDTVDDTDDGSTDDGTAAGAALFASCGGCHCADASGDCLPGSPALIGVSAVTLDDFLRGDATHPLKPALTDQEITDLETYLGSLGGTTDDPITSGEALFALCGGCHCADASGGCLPGAPSLIGVSAATIDGRLRGDDTHPIKPNQTDQEIADLEAYLGSL